MTLIDRIALVCHWLHMLIHPRCRQAERAWMVLNRAIDHLLRHTTKPGQTAAQAIGDRNAIGMLNMRAQSVLKEK